MESTWSQFVRSPSDNWVGVTDDKERRRLQNRLAQRARRARKALRASDPGDHPTVHDPSGSTIDEHAFDAGRPMLESATSLSAYVPSDIGIETAEDVDWSLLDLSPSTLSDGVTIFDAPSVDRSCPAPSFTTDETLLSPYALTLTFTCMDTIAALWRNGYLLKLDCGTSAVPALELAAPPALKFTTLQTSIPHLPLIACLPFPSMRDRIISAPALVNLSDLREDILQMGVRCWGRRPWDGRAWELPKEFAEKWWWLLDEDIIAMTNFWREERDDEPLRWKGAMNSPRLIEIS